VFVAGANGQGCKGCKRQPDRPPDVVDVDTEGVQDVASVLQVVGVEPATGSANQAQPGTVYGAGFAQGATVTVGGLAASGVRVIDANTLALTLPALPLGEHDLVVSDPSGARATLRRAYAVRGAVVTGGDTDCRKVTVYFETDIDGLGPQAEQTLAKKGPCIAARTGRVVVSGHADERGTTDYNLALGQRRAARVASWLYQAGVGRARVEVISFGEERPAVAGSGESAWSQNRRVEIDAY
jgi:hypothetical protein